MKKRVAIMALVSVLCSCCAVNIGAAWRKKSNEPQIVMSSNATLSGVVERRSTLAGYVWVRIKLSPMFPAIRVLCPIKNLSMPINRGSRVNVILGPKNVDKGGVKYHSGFIISSRK